MTTFRTTLETYKTGKKAMAYLAFKADPEARNDVSFEKFCEGMDKVIGNVHSICPATGKVERA